MHADLKPKAVLFDFYKTLLDICTDENELTLWERLSIFIRYKGIYYDPLVMRCLFQDLVQQNLENSSELYPDICITDVFKTILSSTGMPISENLLQDCVHLFRSLSIKHFNLFPDTISTLKILRQHYKLGLVTDAQRVFLDPELRMTGLSDFFDVIIVSSDHLFHKPDPRMFWMAVNRLGVTLNQALYVGDSYHRDIIGADLAGIDSIMVCRNGDASNLCHPKPGRVIYSLSELCSGDFL